MVKYVYDIDTMKKAVSESISLADVARALGIVPAGGNFMTIKKYIVQYDLDISHFHRIPHNLGVLMVGTPRTNVAIKKRLVIQRGHRCERCRLSEWLNEPIPLELEHIDGNSSNQTEKNWLLLCPNCHAKTPTYRRKKSSLIT